MPSCLRLFVQLMRAAASRTFWTAGTSRPIRIAMIAITTSSSISVKARRRGHAPRGGEHMGGSSEYARKTSQRVKTDYREALAGVKEKNEISLRKMRGS